MRPYTDLVKEIRDAVRRKAQDIPKFRNEGNGAIRILAYPMYQEADEWLGGLSEFRKEFNPCAGTSRGYNDIVDYEYTFAIAPGGSRVMTGEWDGVKQKVDCYAYSALKIADCSRSQDEGRGLMSGIVTEDKYRREDNGYGPYRGALCFEVYSSPHRLFCYLYVCVSGAESDEDLECTKAAISVVKKFFEDAQNGFGFSVKTQDF